MKNKFLLILAMSFFHIGTSYADHKIGDILTSGLTEVQFRNVHGTDWVLADGRNISSTSAYAKLTNATKVPDLRGKFLRGWNLGISQNIEAGDSEVRVLFSTQLYGTALPRKISFYCRRLY